MSGILPGGYCQGYGGAPGAAAPTYPTQAASAYSAYTGYQIPVVTALPPNWTEYTSPDGRKYYHNIQTGVTTYEYPKAGNVAVTPNGNDAGGWEEFHDQSSGKTYYYNRITKQCVWEEPEAIRVKKAREQASKLGILADKGGTAEALSSMGKSNVTPAIASTTSVPATTNDPSAEKRAVPNASLVKSTEGPSISELPSWDHLSDKEAIREFKAMLEAKNISPTIKWGEAVRYINLEPQFSCLRTLGEKKQCFAEYQTQRAKQLREERRLRARRSRDQFFQLLASDETITGTTKYRDVREALSSDERFAVVDDDDTREDYFREFVSELDRNEREARRQARSQRKKDFLEDLGKMSFPGGVCAARWNDVRKRVMEMPSVTSDAKTCNRVADSEARTWFDEFQSVCRAEQRNMGKQVRKDMCDFFSQLSTRDLNASSRWHSFVEKAQGYVDGKTETSQQWVQFLGKVNKWPSECRHAFDEVVEKLRARFTEFRKRLLRALRSNPEFRVELKTTLEELEKAAAERSFKIDMVDQGNIKLVFDELLDEAEERELTLKRKKGDFEDLLTEYYYRSDHVGIPWDVARKDLKSRTAFKALSEKNCEELFVEYMAKLLAKKEARRRSAVELEEDPEEGLVLSDEEGQRDDDHGKKKKERKSRKKSSNRRSRSSDQSLSDSDGSRSNSKHRKSKRSSRSRSRSSSASMDAKKKRHKKDKKAKKAKKKSS